MKHIVFALSIFIAASFFLAGCSANPNSAPQVVEAYFKALQAKDEPAMISYSCAAWEADARTEYNSFAAVEMTLESLACQEAGQAGDTILVTCQGSIIASYGAEDLVLELSERTYQVKQEAGEYRMCGYR